MKANEFVKKFGWGKTIELIEFYNRCGSLTCDCDFTYDELKRLAESYELVEAKGGIKKAKKEADCLFSHDIDEAAFHIYNAIADVESCMGEVS